MRVFSFLSKIFDAIASLGSSGGTTGCYWGFLDEPKIPKSLIEKK